MKRGAFLFIAVVALTGIGCGSDSESESEVLDGSYYKVELPSGWVDTTEDDRQQITELTPPGVLFDATATATDADGDFEPNLAIVTTRKVGRVKDSVELAEVNLSAVRRGGSLPLAAGGGAVEARSTEVEQTELGGEPAAAFEQVAETPAGKVLQRQTFVLRDGLAYAITYSGLDGKQYDRYLPDVERMFDSWSWEEVPEIPSQGS